MKGMEMEQLYRIKNAMQKLDVCRATIYRMAARGELDLVKIGRTTRVTSASLDRIISAGKPKS